MEQETILFLHPIVGTRDYWAPQIAALAEEFRCLAIDAPGYRDTPAIGPLEPKSVAKWIAATLDEAGIEKVHIVGLSLGAMFALYAMQHCPERLGKVVLADTSAAFGVDPDQWLTEWLAPLGAGSTPAELAAGAIDAIVANPLSEATRTNLVESFGGVSPEALRVASSCIATHDVSASLPTLRTECLVIVGERDEETPLRYSEELAQKLPNARLEVIAAAGHLSSTEDPEAFNALLRAFLSRDGSSDADLNNNEVPS